MLVLKRATKSNKWSTGKRLIIMAVPSVETDLAQDCINGWKSVTRERL